MKNRLVSIFILTFSILHITSCKVSTQSSINYTGSTTSIIFQDEKFTDKIDFTDKQTNIYDMSATELRGRDLTFVNCVFEKPVFAYANANAAEEVLYQFYGNISFINCEFLDTVNFKGSTFHGKVNMTNSIFFNDVNFQDAIFMQQSNFYKAQFSKKVAFQNARFYHRTSFMEITTADNTSFQSAVFQDDVNFSVSTAYAYMDFSLCRFYGRATFNYLNWEGRAVFNNSTFFMPAEFLKSDFGDVKMENVDKRSTFKFTSG